jgi:hypothetical protein
MAPTKRPKPKKQKKGPPKTAAPSAAPTPSANAEKLMEFYVRLAGDVDFLSDFIADPQAVAKRELGEAEREVLFSGDQGRIYSTLRPDLIPKIPPAPPQPQPVAASQPGAAADPHRAACLNVFGVPPVTVIYPFHYGQQAAAAYPYSAGYPYWPSWPPPYPQQ